MYRPFNVAASAFSASFAMRVNLVHDTVTGPGAMLAPVSNVILMKATSFVAMAVDLLAATGEVTVHLSTATSKIRLDGNVRVISSVAAKAVEVVKETEAVPTPTPMAVLIVKADAALALTAPTAGVLTKAPTVSLEVAIFRPVAGTSVASFTAALGARVISVHDTVTGPGAMLAPAASVILMVSAPYNDVAAATGEVMVHLLLTVAVTRPAGNVRMMLSVAPVKAVEVVKETEAVPLAAAMLVLIVKADAATAVTNPTAGTSTKAATVSLDV